MIRYILLPVIFLSLTTFGQDDTYIYYHIGYRGDTTELLTVKDPSVCDCIKKDYRNEDQKTICDKKYDYDFMTEDEQHEFDVRRTICNSPTICDCALADMKDRGLVKQCDREYRQRWLSDERRQEILNEMKECTEEDLSYPVLIADKKEELEICDCINLGYDEYKLKRECDEKFFDEEELEEDQIDANSQLLQECIENNQFSINPTLCECAEFADSDAEFKAACDNKYNKKKMSPKELEDFEKALDLCTELRFYERLNTLVDSAELAELDTLAKFESTFGEDFPPPPPPPPMGGGLQDLERAMEEAMAEMMIETDITSYSDQPNFGHLEEEMKSSILSTARFTICECYQLKEHEHWLIEACPEYFRLDLLSDSDLVTLKEIRKKCAPTPKVESICDCLEIPDYDKSEEEKEKCKTLLAPLSPVELIKYMNKEKTCN